MTGSGQTLQAAPAGQGGESARRPRPRGARVDRRVARQMYAALVAVARDDEVRDFIGRHDGNLLKPIRAAARSYEKGEPQPVYGERS